MKIKRKYYFCKHCGNKFTDYHMAQLCYDLDMKMLEDKRKLVSISKIA